MKVCFFVCFFVPNLYCFDEMQRDGFRPRIGTVCGEIVLKYGIIN